MIYFIINVLISYSKSIEQKKVSYNEGIKGRRKIINSVLNDAEACEAINNYKISSNENKLIPFAIKWKLTIILEFLCNYLKHLDRRVAYHNIRFEKEAYDNMENMDYLKSRKSYSWLKYTIFPDNK